VPPLFTYRGSRRWFAVGSKRYCFLWIAIFAALLSPSLLPFITYHPRRRHSNLLSFIQALSPAFAAIFRFKLSFSLHRRRRRPHPRICRRRLSLRRTKSDHRRRDHRRRDHRRRRLSRRRPLPLGLSRLFDFIIPVLAAAAQNHSSSSSPPMAAHFLATSG